MKEAGINLVSVGIFSWVLLEPREGEYDFEWLDHLMDLLADAGISVDLGTPTAAPPAWFWKKYPQARPVTREGVPLGNGSRGMASPSSPEYLRAATNITEQLARRYGSHPALVLWHVHNEYGAPVSDSYDDYSVAAFREWLQARYGTLDALNQAWGTLFWGQKYGEWDEIDAPRLAASVSNQAQRLDFRRFTSDALLQVLRRRAGRDPQIHAGAAGDHQLHGHQLPRRGLLEVEPRGGHRLQRPLPRGRTHGQPHPARPWTPTSRARWPATGPGCSWNTPPGP